jgi:rod shape-determining protein MreD
MRIKSSIAFGLACCATLGVPIFFPRVHLFYFVPYLVVSLYRHERIALLWRACLCGVCVDLLSSGSLFGLTAMNYCCVTFLLYKQTRNFFEDKLSTLPLMTFLFSFLSTGFLALAALFLQRSYPLGWSWVATDWIGMSMADAAYALFVFSLPLELVAQIRKMRLLKTS